MPEPEIVLDAAPRERTRPRRRTLAAALTVVVLGAAAVTGGVVQPVMAEKDAVLATPDSIGPLQLDLSDDGKATAASLREQLSARIDLDSTVGAVYLDGTGRNVLFLGGISLLWAPESTLDSAFGVVADIEGASMSSPRTLNAGPLGGTMKCADTQTDDGDVIVCGWADHGSLALAEFIGRHEPESATLLRQIRSATQTRS